MVVPDNWTIIYPRFITTGAHGIFCRRVCLGGEAHKRHIIYYSGKLN